MAEGARGDRLVFVWTPHSGHEEWLFRLWGLKTETAEELLNGEAAVRISDPSDPRKLSVSIMHNGLPLTVTGIVIDQTLNVNVLS